MQVVYPLVLIAVVMDLRNMRISNRLILIGLGSALILRLFRGGLYDMLLGILLISFPVILLYLLFLLGVLGAGDIKLFSLIGGFVNFKELMMCIVYAFLCAAVFSFVKMLYCGTFFSSMQNVGLYLRRIGMGEIESYQVLYGKRSKIHFSVAVFFGLCLAKIL